MTAPTRRAPDAARATGAVAALTLVSRVTGLARVVVVAAVLGTTFLGNTYQTANTVPNVVFELVAAGVLTAVLLPTLVRLLDGPSPADGEHVARSVLGLALVPLGALAVLGFVAAPGIVRLLLAGAPEGPRLDEQVRVGAFLLRCFAPQVLLYAAGTVATGVLHARGRFGLPAVAPAVNNVVVVGAYLWFGSRRAGDTGLDVPTGDLLVLGLGTTAGVLAFCAVPVVAAVRAGVSLRPRLDHRHPEVRRLARLGGWAAAQVGAAQGLLVVVLLLANGVEGGVVAYQVAFTAFLLPHALLAIPVATALAPVLARQADAGTTDLRSTAADGVLAVLLLSAPAAAALVALAEPVAEVVTFGAAESGRSAVAGALAGFGPGLVGYGALLLLARARYAAGDARSPALVHLVVLVVGGATMAVAAAVAGLDDRIAWLAAAHSAAHLVGAALLARVVLGHDLRALARPAAVTVAAAGAAWAAGAALVAAVGPSGRAEALATVLLGGALVLGTYAVVQRVVGGVRPATVPALLRGGAR